MSVDFQHIANWLMENAQENADLRALTEQLVIRLRTAGMPIDRLNLGVLALHPEMAGYAVLWEVGMNTAIEVPIRRDDMRKPTYLDSPIRYVVEQNECVNFDLHSDAMNTDFPVLEEFREQGYRQYLGFPIPYGENGSAVLTMCTKNPDGFNESQTIDIQKIFRILSLLLSVVETKRLAQTLLRTYLGRYTADRVLAGEILRGQGKRVQAAVWMCDLRGFTAMTSQVGSFAMIDTLNQYFDCMAKAIWEEGGEILKFMGDAMLAVFPIGQEHTEQQAARRAIDAAQKAIQFLDAVSNERVANGLPPLRAGIAAHIGEVVYGNIGASTRLDFTVMGHAVNLVARIQTLTGERNEAILFSADVAKHLEHKHASVGRHQFKGISSPIEIFKSVD